MKNEPYVIEQSYKANVERVWKAISSSEEMKQWYFDIPEFIAEPGFEFQFVAGPDDTKQYQHRCKVLEVIPGHKLSYSWRYEGYEGNSLVTFELWPQGELTRLKLTNEGLESFPATQPDFSKDSFAEGWTWIIGTVLKMYVEKRLTAPQNHTNNYK